MSLSNLYFKCCFEPLSPEQKNALDEICAENDVVDKSCSREDVNTCGITLEELFERYSLYSPQKGLYKKWGDIVFPWKISDLTENLLYSSTNDKWSIANYQSIISYKQGSRVLVIEDGGYEVVLYEAKEDISAISIAFDKDKWIRICSIKTTERITIPTPEELIDLYQFYELKPFESEWGEVNTEWSDNLFENSFNYCRTSTTTVIELEKCLKRSSSDKWGEMRAKKLYFYRAGDLVLVESECGDTLSLYTAMIDIPVNDYIINTYKDNKFSEYMYLSEDDELNNQKTLVWKLVYFVPTDQNKCLDYQRKKTPEQAYDVIRIGSLGHYVEAPISDRLKSKEDLETLDSKSGTRIPRASLTDREIFDLDHNSYPYATEEC